MKLSNILRKVIDGNGDSHLNFYCPGCDEVHSVKISGANAWGFNGNAERPTFTPSVLVRKGHYVPGKTMDDCWCKYDAEHPEDLSGFTCGVCHSFVTDGRIQFLSDCTHGLSGQTVDLPDFILGVENV